MSKAQAESVIKNIIREIIQECASLGKSFSETLVAFIVKAVVLDPANNFNVDRTLTKDDVKKLIKVCVERLSTSKSSSLDTIKLQVYFDMNYTVRQEFLEEHHKVLESRILPVTREVTDYRARTREEFESLYRKIVTYVLLRSGMGSATDIAVVRETTAALQSVFPQTELGTFMLLTKSDKERQLQELTYIVSGIRLFNKECGKTSEGVDDLPGILNEAIPATTENIHNSLQSNLLVAFRYTALVEKYILQRSVPPSEISLELMKDALINVRQYINFLQILLNDVISCAKKVESLAEQLNAQMEQLKLTVQSKAAVPTAQVYPQFINIAHTWVCFQDEMVLLSVLSNVFSNMDQFTITHKEIFPEELILPCLENIEVKTDSHRMIESSENKINSQKLPNNNDIILLFPETIKNVDKLYLQYKSFCAWSLVKNDRLLLPGNPDIGILQYKKHFYSFSSAEAAYSFAQNPDEYISKVADAAKRSPELIQFLELHQQFSSLSSYTTKDKNMIEQAVTKSDCGCQTVTHIQESNIVKDYEWNEWELRRKALKLANLRTKLTKSNQTNLSNLRRDNSTQVYLPREQTTQTKADGESNVPKPLSYLYGLRGLRGEGNFVKINLTQPID